VPRTEREQITTTSSLHSASLHLFHDDLGTAPGLQLASLNTSAALGFSF
jgi:hypothetical protein